MAILVPCTKPKNRDELSAKNDTIIFTDFDSSIIKKILVGIEKIMPERYLPDCYLQELHRLAEQHNVTALFNTDDYLGCIYTSILGRERGLMVPPLESILTCQHKYYARCAQQKFVPEATPPFAIVSKDYLGDVKKLFFPLFVKPVKSHFSVYARPIHTMQQLEAYLHNVTIPEQYLIPFNWALQHYTDFVYDGTYFIAEQLLRGRQVTLEGYVFEGEVCLIGIVDSVMVPDTLSFERFIYPSSLPHSVQERMLDIAQRFVKGVGLNMTLFNIEYMYDEQTDVISIIEINPRMASQFCDLFKMVKGISNYDVQYDIVKGRKPVVRTDGEFKIAASLVCRQLEDKKVLSAPTEKDVCNARVRFPELKFYPWVTTGDKLSDVLQDGTSYVYGWIHLGAQNAQELEEKYAESKKLLPFVFETV